MALTIAIFGLALLVVYVLSYMVVAEANCMSNWELYWWIALVSLITGPVMLVIALLLAAIKT